MNFDVKELAALVDPKDVPAVTVGATAAEKKKNFAIELHNKLFAAEPSAVLQRMVQNAELPIASTTARAGVGDFLANQPDFNIRTTSVYKALKHPDAFKGIAEEHRPEVVRHLKTLQRVQAISPVPEAVPILMKANLTSAFRIAEMAESTFLSAHGKALGEESAQQVYTAAINTHIRNEHALETMRDAWVGPGLAILGGQEPREARMAKLQAVAGSTCPAVEPRDAVRKHRAIASATTVCRCIARRRISSTFFSYLRNNNLDPANPNTGQKGILGTPLEKLFRRRPDLGCLELTCPNTFTVLPYIDLVNEVMESFVVHLDEYHLDPNMPKQAMLEVFNVDDETTSELLAEPQHINYKAYCILKDAVYPFTLPYHQPIDAARIFLKQMGTSRYELLDTFRTAGEVVTAALTSAEQQELQTLHGMVLNRSADAEFLGITQEEHIILTREAFWPKAYFDLTRRQLHTAADYQQKIGVRPIHEYDGYRTAAEMLDLDETSRIGLTFVKKQFLVRTGIQYVDLVELLKTRFINPAFPQGEALMVLESIRFSYRFLQMLVDTGGTDPRKRFDGLIDFLNATQPVLPELDALLHPDPCHEHAQEHCVPKTDFQHWVHCYFERIGKLIVLESGDGPHLPIEGGIFQVGPPPVLVGTLRRDGLVVDGKGVRVGQVTITAQVLGTDGKPFVTRFGGSDLTIKNAAGETIGFVDAQGLRGQREERLNWLPAQDTCDLDKVRLTHLDGSALTPDEYDRLQRFIRLWHKLDWTVPETDLALIGTSSTAAYAGKPGGATGSGAPGTPGGTQGRPTAGAGNGVGFEMFQPECPDGDDSDEEGCGKPPAYDPYNCPDKPKVAENISTEFLHQLVAIRKLLDLTGLPLDKLLSFWADINVAGTKPCTPACF